MSSRSSRPCPRSCAGPKKFLLHVSLNPIRFKDKNTQQLKVLQRPLRVS
ncbi:hypothetical protein GFB56_27800 [Ensifer sp. T173]|uniref:Uncharacterized protein n=1 Tax=Ensifer canadensis TaxID=555315 RepID=A0AAW4FTB6_9HYPH|nr:hypothetical protein [Ensifer canadensis]